MFHIDHLCKIASLLPLWSCNIVRPKRGNKMVMGGMSMRAMGGTGMTAMSRGGIDRHTRDTFDEEEEEEVEDMTVGKT